MYDIIYVIKKSYNRLFYIFKKNFVNFFADYIQRSIIFISISLTKKNSVYKRLS